MNTTLKNILLFVAVVVIGLAAGYAGAMKVVSEQAANLGATNYNRPISFDAGILVNNREVLNSSGDLIIGSGGTEINKYLCGTNTTFNPAAITSSTDSYATTSVTVSGAAIGDVVLVTLATSTSADLWTVTGKVTTAGQVNVILTSAGALNLATTTVKACVIN